MSLYYVKVSLNLRVDAALAPIYAHCGNAARCLLTSFLGVFLLTLLDAVRRGRDCSSRKQILLRPKHILP